MIPPDSLHLPYGGINKNFLNETRAPIVFNHYFFKVNGSSKFDTASLFL
jgi:hypothetical protein